MFCFGILIGPLLVFVPLNLFLAIVFVCVLLFTLSPSAMGKSEEVMFRIAKWKWFGLLFLILVLGIFRYTQSEIPKNIFSVRDAIGRSVRVQGIVSGEPSVQGMNQHVTIRRVAIADTPSFGKVLIKMNALTPVHYNDLISFNCTLNVPKPMNGFDYARFLQAKGILATCDYPKFMDIVPRKTFSFVRSVLSIKQNLIEQMNRLFPEPHASFLFGLVFGGTIGLDKDVQNDFSRTGTSHILAASGFNVSLFTFVFLGWIIQTSIGKKRGVFVTAFLLLVYVVMAGASAAVVRAAILGAVILLGTWINRRASIHNALLLAAVLILFFNPRVLLDDVGFQLSFAATAAILYVVPRWKKNFSFVPETLGMREALVGSLSAILITLPIMLWQFGSVSIIAPFVNLFVLPFVPIMMGITLLALAVSVVWFPLGLLVAIPAWAGSWFILAVITIFSSLSIAYVPVPFARAMAVVSLGIILVSFYMASLKTMWNKLSKIISSKK